VLPLQRREKGAGRRARARGGGRVRLIQEGKMKMMILSLPTPTLQVNPNPNIYVLEFGALDLLFSFPGLRASISISMYILYSIYTYTCRI